ncbi:MBL fold metallo-hydrolase [Xaviernesmea oryzae]|uniref:MBL fold metallo-hydrolase n=1 Tax=Xaviernesmea oryzae TaxID=464029 RepID=A0A1Q9B382_9HYPH|nr:MBL fold metallo-hydrolase [Xaviernesmea oryzae]OLP62467.1 MBL fold metallo-hydrolase [Xaviernesmea oryzae]SEM17429.1 Glyoxylase, beta-lactamase superfamily II [Xaviernesmea oryzae]
MTPIVELATYPGLDPRLVILRAGEEVDAVLVRTERFDLLVDTLGTPEACRAALDLIAAHFGDEALRPLITINSHMDWDHVWGNAAVTGRGPIIAHAAALSRFHDPAMQAVLQQKQAEEARFATVKLVAPDISFSGTLRLDGGDLTFELIHTPGHTPDHLVVWIPELRICLAVDAVEWPIPEVWSQNASDLAAIRASFERIRALDAAFVITAHGRSHAPALVDANLRYFDALSDRVAKANLSRLAEPHMDEASDFALKDFVALPQEMDSATRSFYEGCHRTNLGATIKARLDA